MGITAPIISPILGQPFWHLTNANVSSYATPLPGGDEHLKLYTTPDPTGSFNWYFAHREKGKAAVHAIPLVQIRQPNGSVKEFVHLIVQKSPVMGGTPVLQLPAGMWGDHDLSESALRAVSREANEESGYDVRSGRMLTDQLFATSPGMTTEMKGFGLVHVTGQPGEQHRKPSEKLSIIESFDVPVETFTHYPTFMTWLSDMSRKYTIGIDVLAVRALLPPTKAGRKFQRWV